MRRPHPAYRLLLTVTSLKRFAAGITPSGRLATRVAVTRLGGTPVVVLTDTKGGGTLYVRNINAPVPLRITGGAAHGDTVTLTHYGKSVRLKRPTA